MKIAQDGLDLIKKFEGLRLRAYQDSVGVWTIGYGHTRTAKRDMTIMPQTAEAFLRQDVESAEDDVRNLVHVELLQREYDALVSFVFNLGGPALRKSTLLSKLNGFDKEGVADEFPRWVYAGKKKLSGLVRRRNAERALFLGQPWKGF